jgi:hypothetical protein
MHFYRAYGLCIQSELKLPELVATDNRGEAVVIRFGEVEPLPAEVDSQFHSFWATPQEVCLCFRDGGAYLIRNGNEIIIQPSPNVAEQVIRLGVLGPALSMLLHQRGLLVLHGSAMLVDGQAIACLGNSGDGKSTMAAALTRRGHSLVADDLAVVDFDSDQVPFLLPGFPQLKLWPEAVTVLGDNPDDLARLHPAMEKRARRIGNENFSADILPLRRIYVLQEADTLGIELLSRQQAFIELVRYSHNALLLDQTGSAAHHFQQCTQLVRQVRVCRLNRPRDLTLLPEVAHCIEADLA